MESEDEESVTGSEEEVRMAMNFCLLIIQSRWYYERLDQTRGLKTDMFRTGIEPGASTEGGEQSRKEPFQQLVNRFLEHRQMSPRQYFCFIK
jgi:hypothetical protein